MISKSLKACGVVFGSFLRHINCLFCEFADPDPAPAAHGRFANPDPATAAYGRFADPDSATPLAPEKVAIDPPPPHVASSPILHSAPAAHGRFADPDSATAAHGWLADPDRRHRTWPVRRS